MTDQTPAAQTSEPTMRDALDALAEAFPVDEISDAPWVVERGSIAWMIREGEHGPQVGNFILEADARWVAAARNAIEAEAAAPASPDVVQALRHTERLLTELLPAADNAALIHEQLTAERDHLRQILATAYAEGEPHG